MLRAPSGPDNFELSILGDFLGYNSSVDPTKDLKHDGILVRGSQNMYKKLSGTISVRPGLKLRGAADATQAGTKSSWEWNAWDGTVRPMRINNGTLQFESDIVSSGSPIWYTLLSGLASSFNRTIFDAVWNTAGAKDTLIFVGGTADLYSWSGGQALFVSGTINTIVLDRDAAVAGFSSSGSVVLNGTTYTYGAISGSTLTSVGANSSAEAANSVVFELPLTHSSTPTSSYANDFLKVINNQVYVGSYTSRAIYLSKGSGATNYTDYAQSTPRLSGEGGLIYLDNNGCGITVKAGSAWIGSGTSDWWVISFNQITVGSVLTEQIVQKKQPTSINSAPLGHEFIDTIGDEIICLTQDHQVRNIGQFANQFTTRYPSLSLDVKTEFQETDFTGGHLRCIGDIVYITAPNQGIDWMHETRENIGTENNIITEKFWHPPQVRNISRYAVIEGDVFGHSNAYPQIYQVWDTGQWYDDSPDGSQLPIENIMLLKYRNHGRRQGKINFDKIFTEGYSTENSMINGAAYYNYQGGSGILNFIVNSPESPFQKTFTGIQPPSLGDASLGDNPLGSSLNIAADDQATVPKWKQINPISLINCYEYAIMLYSQNPNARWEVLALGTNATLAPFAGVEIVKKK